MQYLDFKNIYMHMGRGERKEKKNDFDKVTKSKHQLIIVTLQVSPRKQMLIVTVNRN